MAIGFVIARDEVGPMIKSLAGKLSLPQRVVFLIAWGRDVALQAQRNARAKGGRRFWTDIARSVNVRSVSSEGVEVASDHVAAAQMQYGGVIEAPGRGPGSKHASALAIPLPEAGGRPPSAFTNRHLFVLPSKRPDTKGILGYSTGKGENEVFHPLFVLRKRTKFLLARPFFPTAPEVLAEGERLAARKLAVL